MIELSQVSCNEGVIGHLHLAQVLGHGPMSSVAIGGQDRDVFCLTVILKGMDWGKSSLTVGVRRLTLSLVSDCTSCLMLFLGLPLRYR
jgi:hypothetical protein